MFRHARATLTAIALLALVPTVATAGVNRWTSNGPPGGVFQAVVVDPTGYVFAGAAPTADRPGNGVFVSTDGGTSWSPFNSGLATNDVFDIALGAQAPITLYAAASDAFYRNSERRIWMPFPVVPQCSTDLDCGPPPALCQDKICVPPTPMDGPVLTLGVDPAMPSTVVATTGRRVFFSTNSGKFWVDISNNLPVTHVRALSVSSVMPDAVTVLSTVYAGTEAGVWRTCEQSTGTRPGCDGYWAAINAGLTDPDVFVLAMDPANVTHLYAGTDSGLFISTNGGDQWSNASNGLPAGRVAAVALDSTNPSTLYVGMVAGTQGAGVLKSTDAGGTWTALAAGLGNTAVYALAVDPTTPTTVYAGTADMGVFDIEQGGAPICAGDCDGSGDVTVNEIITLVNIDLGIADASTCPHGVPSGVAVDITQIVAAVGYALTNCPAS